MGVVSGIRKSQPRKDELKNAQDEAPAFEKVDWKKELDQEEEMEVMLLLNHALGREQRSQLPLGKNTRFNLTPARI